MDSDRLYRWYVGVVTAATLLTLCVVVLGAWVRLSDAGLGCPDWPGCYGSLIVPEDEDAKAAAEAAFPDRPLDPSKAWAEMIHRYVATTLGFLIILVALFAWLNRRRPRQPVILPLVTLGTVIFQGLLGMWTVTLLLKPLIVMAHLLGGLTTLSMLFWLLLEHVRRSEIAANPLRRAWKPAVAGLIVLVCQIALGGWTSSNYAALACPDLPTCQGQWWPENVNFSEGFVMWRGLGIDYEFGVLDAPSRVAIHYTHRLGALVTFVLLAYLAIRSIRERTSQAAARAGTLVFAALTAQVLIGMGVVWFGIPLFLAAAHNGVAALLLLSVINLNHAAALARGPGVQN